jgi:hypothetical protein
VPPIALPRVRAARIPSALKRALSWDKEMSQRDASSPFPNAFPGTGEGGIQLGQRAAAGRRSCFATMGACYQAWPRYALVLALCCGIVTVRAAAVPGGGLLVGAPGSSDHKSSASNMGAAAEGVADGPAAGMGTESAPALVEQLGKARTPGGEPPPLVPLDGRDWALLSVILLSLSLAGGAGIGGGAILVPSLLLIEGFGTKYAVALSNVAVLGGSIANIACTIPKCVSCRVVLRWGGGQASCPWSCLDAASK